MCITCVCFDPFAWQMHSKISLHDSGECKVLPAHGCSNLSSIHSCAVQPAAEWTFSKYTLQARQGCKDWWLTGLRVDGTMLACAPTAGSWIGWPRISWPLRTTPRSPGLRATSRSTRRTAAGVLARSRRLALSSAAWQTSDCPNMH